MTFVNILDSGVRRNDRVNDIALSLPASSVSGAQRGSRAVHLLPPWTEIGLAIRQGNR